MRLGPWLKLLGLWAGSSGLADLRSGLHQWVPPLMTVGMLGALENHAQEKVFPVILSAVFIFLYTFSVLIKVTLTGT